MQGIEEDAQLLIEQLGVDRVVELAGGTADSGVCLRYAAGLDMPSETMAYRIEVAAACFRAMLSTRTRDLAPEWWLSPEPRLFMTSPHAVFCRGDRGKAIAALESAWLLRVTLPQ